MFKRLGMLAALAAFAALPAAPAAANSNSPATQTVNVSGSVLDDCNSLSQTDTTSGLNFAAFDPLNAKTIQATASFSINCSTATVVKVYLDGSTSSDRTMTGTSNSSHTLSYQIYESDYATAWPTSASTAVTVGTSASKNTAITWTLYGQLDNTANADAAYDSYSGSFTMDVAY
jgi:hypothetical protein